MLFQKKILVNKLMDYEVLIFREPKDIRKIRKQKNKAFLPKLTKEDLLKIKSKFIKISRIITLNFILILFIQFCYSTNSSKIVYLSRKAVFDVFSLVIQYQIGYNYKSSSLAKVLTLKKKNYHNIYFMLTHYMSDTGLSALNIFKPLTIL